MQLKLVKILNYELDYKCIEELNKNNRSIQTPTAAAAAVTKGKINIK
jgi:hypothetical protein